MCARACPVLFTNDLERGGDRRIARMQCYSGQCQHELTAKKRRRVAAADGYVRHSRDWWLTPAHGEKSTVATPTQRHGLSELLPLWKEIVEALQAISGNVTNDHKGRGITEEEPEDKTGPVIVRPDASVVHPVVLKCL